MQIRPATPDDVTAIDEVVHAAFGDHGHHVMLLVEALRAAAANRDAPGVGPWYRELVATDGGEVVGHVGLSPQWLVDVRRDRTEVGCLSPLSVVPARQRAGIGRALVAAVAALARGFGLPAVVLEGDPAVYSRYGWSPATSLGLARVSPLIPEPAQQVLALAGEVPRGRLMYAEPVWWAGGSGLSVDPLLDELSRQAGAIAALTLDPATSMPGVPGWDADALLEHLGTVYRVVTAWLRDGARPRAAPLRATVAPEVDPWHWMVDAWHDLHDELARRPADAVTATWCAFDHTVGFWRRRMLHETAIHAFDALAGAGLAATRWYVPDDVASDGVREALQLWLGTMLGADVGGAGERVAVVPDGEEPWITALHGGVVEVHRLGGDVDARVGAPAAALYRWLWGRAADAEVVADGDPDAVRALRLALGRAMQ